MLGGKWRWQWKNARYAERKSIQSIILSKNAPNAVPGSATITLGITNGNVFCVRPIRSTISTEANNHSAYRKFNQPLMVYSYGRIKQRRQVIPKDHPSCIRLRIGRQLFLNH